MNKKQKILLGLIVFLAIFFRFYQINKMPGGLFPDEAANGLDINLMQTGNLQPFYERGNGREALFFYMLWGSVEIFGKGPWQHHIISSLIGVLSVLVCFLVTRKLFSLEIDTTNESYKTSVPYLKATNIALLASFLMAVSSWYTVLSRTAFRANLIPLFSGLVFYFLLCVFKSTDWKKYVFSVLSGAVFALGFYTYIAYRILVPIVAVLVIFPWFANGFVISVKKYWKQCAFFILAFVIFIYPLAKYFHTHPGSFVGRSGQVSVFNPELNQGNLIGAILEVGKESIFAYFTTGDLNWRHNVSGVPFLSQLVSPFFGVALIIITLLAIWYIFTPKKNARFWKYCLLAAWFWGMLIPVITTAEGIPHGLRSIGTIPVVFIISALGLYWFGEFIFRIHGRIMRKYSESKETSFSSIVAGEEKSNTTPNSEKIIFFSFKLTVICFCLALILQTYFLYFIYAANSPENFYSFRSDLTRVGSYLTQRCNKDQTYLILDKFSVQTTDYITSNKHGIFNDKCNVPYKQVDPENSWELTGVKPGDEIIFTQSSIFDIKKFKKFHPEARLLIEWRNKFGQTIMAVYKID